MKSGEQAQSLWFIVACTFIYSPLSWWNLLCMFLTSNVKKHLFSSLANNKKAHMVVTEKALEVPFDRFDASYSTSAPFSIIAKIYVCINSFYY